MARSCLQDRGKEDLLFNAFHFLQRFSKGFVFVERVGELRRLVISARFPAEGLKQNTDMRHFSQHI